MTLIITLFGGVTDDCANAEGIVDAITDGARQFAVPCSIFLEDGLIWRGSSYNFPGMCKLRL